MRILYVSSFYKPAYVYGGPVRCISQVCEGLAKLGAQVTVLTTNANGNDLLDVSLEQPVNVDGVEVLYYPRTRIPPRNFFYSPALALACRQKINFFDIVILQTLFTHAMGPATNACKQATIPYVIQTHGQLLPWALQQGRIKKQIYQSLIGNKYLNGAAGLHCTDPLEVAAIDRLGITSPAFVVPNGVDSGFFAHGLSGKIFRQRFNISNDARLILFLGRLHPVKHPELAVEALAAAQSLKGEVHLVLAGPDEAQLASELQTRAKRLGCSNYLHMTGLLQPDEVLSALAGANLLIMPSESENFGMSALEAMAAGVPVLLSNKVPIGYWVERFKVGRVVPCTQEAFNRATCEMLKNPELLKEMGKRGRGLVRQQFDISIVSRQMLAQYQSIISQGKPLPDLQLAEV